MTTALSEKKARLLRVRAQGLWRGKPESSVASVVQQTCGLQAQDYRQAPLSIRVRGNGLTTTDVDRALFDDRSIMRTWCMRGTFHYVSAADYPWLNSLFGPLYVNRGQRRLTNLGIAEDDANRAVALIQKELADRGPLTREEVADRLLQAGFEFDADGQAPFHILRRACLEGVVIPGAIRDGEETYELLDDWNSMDSIPDRGEQLARLARRYVAAYEPATRDGLYSWSGLFKRDVNAGWTAIKDELTEVTVAGERMWIISNLDEIQPVESPIVRLLPMYDSYFLGHQNRDLVVPDKFANKVYPGGGVIRATVIVDGVAAGTWTLNRSRATPRIQITPFETLPSTVEAGIETEVPDIERFLDAEITLEMERT